MGCCDGLSKCFLITFGILFLLFGGACLGGGIYVLVAKNDILILARSATDGAVDTIDAPSLIERAAHVLIAIGSFILCISFVGCCGACLKSKCLLRTYVIIVGLMIVLEVAAAILAAVFMNKMETYAKDNLQTMLNDNYIGPYATSNAVSLAFDLAQILLDCCGVVNRTEYASITTWNTTYAYNSSGVYVTANATIPLTCCQFNNKDAFPDEMTTFINSMVNNTCPVTQTGAHTTGCYEALKEEFSKYFNIMVGIAAGMGGLQIIGFISACCLMKEDRKTKDII
ncbi:tetraspanin-18 [Mytilus galloprovincialis]|uniref:Tetraspanin n=1 Tax=Mytilus galloprovincialis TaxID=29158 RepID=A0A8B6FQB8_MYTGA|nr:tetraspanin-18 [Mytilus galloprovincialis]